MKAKGKKPTPKKKAQPRRKTVKIFISHSRRDASLVRLIIDLLRTSNLHQDEIRCTSVPKYGLVMGDDIDALRDEIAKCKIIIAVLTKDSLDSLHVLLELGAGWGLKKRLIPITGPGIRLSGLPSWLGRKHGMRWNHRGCWNDFKPDVFDLLGKTIKDEERFDKIVWDLIHWTPIEPKKRRVKPKKRSAR